MFGIIACTVGTIFVLLADYFIKVAESRDLGMASPHFLFGAALYGLSAAAWYVTMRYMTLAQLSVIYSVFLLLFASAMGVMVFGEKIFLREYLGLAMAIGALILMSRFTA